ncbi:hypothetical protein NKH77_19555 [Streptomyces sp. M19]
MVSTRAYRPRGNPRAGGGVAPGTGGRARAAPGRPSPKAGPGATERPGARPGPSASAGRGRDRRRGRVAGLPLREALRLRVRWTHEFQVRLVREAAARLVERGELRDAEQVALLRWREFVDAVRYGTLPADLSERLPRQPSAPCPTPFGSPRTA